MASLCLSFALLGTCLACAQGFQRSMMEVVVPQRIPPDISGNTDKMTFMITLEGMAYTIRLKRQSLLSNNFRVYTYGSDKSLNSVVPSIARNCYYQGYIEDFVNSVVMLRTCIGLEGLLQFENATYGIEPMGEASGFQHLVYLLMYANASQLVPAESYSIIWTAAVVVQKPLSEMLESSLLNVRYLEIYVVVTHDLYKFWGAVVNTVTDKIVRLFGFVNAILSSLYVNVILTSLEIWTEMDEIPTTGNVDKLLERFAKWKQSHLALRPHDVALLLVSRDRPSSVGSTFARKICLRDSSAGTVVYLKGITLENFSVRVTQMLAFSLGIHLDNSTHCQCSGSTCVMDPRAIRSVGSKFFSSCSLKDYQNFLRNGDVHCLSNKPRMDFQLRPAVCGNKIVETGEQCDCGTAQQCRNNPCCDPNCKLKRGKVCAQGLCCSERQCTLKPIGTLCRDNADKDCDLKEYCNGTSPECTENMYVQDGQPCDGGKTTCNEGVCQIADRSCQKLFGRGSKNGSPQCYEEINSQKDRMGNCGVERHGYISCLWKNLRCGKLVCEYPNNKPFAIDNAAIIYARVKNKWCVTLDSMRGSGEKDPFLVHDGTGCGEERICLKQICEVWSVKNLTCEGKKNCSGNGVCNNKGNCHCDQGWIPPDCKQKQRGGLGGSIDSTFRGGTAGGSGVSVQTRNWLLISFLLFLPATIGSVLLLGKLREFYLGKWRMEREGDYDSSTERESETERSQETYPSETETARTIATELQDVKLEGTLEII